jgi:cation diffusion facilitator CzcD-associated flavoprotein CzcO
MHATDVAIVGAGPYGLSAAAQLKSRGIDFRIFGKPMIFWQRMLPKINLKSPDFGTNIYTAERGHTFVEWCKEKGYSRQEPIPMARFTEYGIDIQRRLLPMVETAEVAGIQREGDGFAVSLGDGTRFRARKVISAVGLTYFANVPAPLDQLPRYFVSHTSHHPNYQGWAGKEVVVLGGGQSALEAAAALNEAGAKVQIAVRAPDVYFASPPSEGRRPLRERLKMPASVLGPGWLNFSLQRAPLWPHLLPDAPRVRLTKNHLGPWGAWWVRQRVEGQVQVLGNVEVAGAREDGSRLRLKLRQSDGGERDLTVDHVVCGTGYIADVSRLPFLAPELAAGVRRIERAPRLSWKFESSVPGLYFIGQAASLSFGPLFRFVAGAQYAAPTVARHIAGSLRGRLAVPTLQATGDAASTRS